MTDDHKHPGENNPPHKPKPGDESPHNDWEGPVEGEDLNEIDPGKISRNMEEVEKGK